MFFALAISPAETNVLRNDDETDLMKEKVSDSASDLTSYLKSELVSDFATDLTNYWKSTSVTV